MGIINLPNGQALGGQAAQGLYEIILREEFARLNELTGSLTLTSGVQATAGDRSIVDSLEGTVVWEYDSMACPQTIVRLYRGMMKVYVNQSNTYEGSTAVVEHQDKDQAGEEEEGMYLKWGTVGERKRGMGRKGGGGQYTSNLGTGWTGIAPHAKERFQVSKRGSGTGEGFSRQRRITKGIVSCTSDIMPTLYISCQMCVCRANKELCLGYK